MDVTEVVVTVEVVVISVDTLWELKVWDVDVSNTSVEELWELIEVAVG